MSASGVGSGSGSVDTADSQLSLTHSGLSFSQLEQSRTIDIIATNSNTSPQRPSGLTATVTEKDGCPDGSFTISNPEQNNNEVPASGRAVVGTVTVTFHNLSERAQNGCLGADAALLTLGTN